MRIGLARRSGFLKRSGWGRFGAPQTLSESVRHSGTTPRLELRSQVHSLNCRRRGPSHCHGLRESIRGRYPACRPPKNVEEIPLPRMTSRWTIARGVVRQASPGAPIPSTEWAPPPNLRPETDNSRCATAFGPFRPSLAGRGPWRIGCGQGRRPEPPQSGGSATSIRYLNRGATPGPPQDLDYDFRFTA